MELKFAECTLNMLGQLAKASVERSDANVKHAEDELNTAAQYLAEAHRRIQNARLRKRTGSEPKVPTWDEWLTEHKIGRSRSYELLAIANGSKTISGLRLESAQRSAKHFEKKVAEAAVSVLTDTPAPITPDSKPAKPVETFDIDEAMAAPADDLPEVTVIAPAIVQEPVIEILAAPEVKGLRALIAELGLTPDLGTKCELAMMVDYRTNSIASVPSKVTLRVEIERPVEEPKGPFKIVIGSYALPEPERVEAPVATESLSETETHEHEQTDIVPASDAPAVPPEPISEDVANILAEMKAHREREASYSKGGRKPTHVKAFHFMMRARSRLLNEQEFDGPDYDLMRELANEAKKKHGLNCDSAYEWLLQQMKDHETWWAGVIREKPAEPIIEPATTWGSKVATVEAPIVGEVEPDIDIETEPEWSPGERKLIYGDFVKAVAEYTPEAA
jgi:hypothetical protein